MSEKGTLKFVDIGPGQWVLDTKRGKVSLFGEIDPALDGREVVVEGDDVEGMSNSMTGGRAMTIRSVRTQ